MHVEANVPPLDIRRKYISLKYYNKLLDAPATSPLAKALGQYRYIPNTNKNVFQRMSELVDDWYQMEINHRDMPVFSNMSPWWDVGTYMKLDFQGYENVQSLNSWLCIQIYDELVAEAYPGYLKMFTDGSKTENNVGMGLVVPDMGVEINYKLNIHMTIMAAELVAIDEALAWVMRIGVENVVLMTDSLNALYLIKTGT